MKVLYTPAEMKRMTVKKILRILRSHGHLGWKVGPETMDTPGGAARIHALTHAWADNYPMVHWSPADIQLEHHLATMVMRHYGFHPKAPITPALLRGIRRYGPDAWRHKSKGIKSPRLKVPSGKYRREVDEYNPAAGDKLKVYWDTNKDIPVVYVVGPERAVAFCPTDAQWRRLKKYHARRPMRIAAKQIIPQWRPTRIMQQIMIG